MYPVSQRFLDALRGNHQIVTRVDVLDGVTNEVIQSLEIEDGYVRIDREADNRRQVDLVLSRPEYVPSTAADILHPLSGNEIKVYRGIKFPDEDELVPLGIFGIEDSDTTDSGEKVETRVKGFDRSKRIQNNRWTSLYIVEEGTNVVEAIKSIISFKIDGIQFKETPTTMTTPPLAYGYGDGGGDPWEAVTNLATSIGYEVFFDGEGVCVIRPEPDLASDPVVARYEEGQYSTVLNIDKKQTREGVYNHVIVFGLSTSTNEPIRIDVVDDNPNSPTYIGGAFGDVPTWMPSTTIMTEDQAYAAGLAYLRQKLGVPEQIQLITIVNPAHEDGDVIEISRSRVGLVNSRNILDKLTIPLSYSQSLNLGCRENRVP